jgi:plasmid stabilization system protein ParE
LAICDFDGPVLAEKDVFRQGGKMPKGWSDKDERKYEHIKEGYKGEGISEDEAQERAARTVNKARREEGRTENSRTQGTGNPNSRLDSRSKDELENRAKELDVPGYSSMSKDELIDAIREKS